VQSVDSRLGKLKFSVRLILQFALAAVLCAQPSAIQSLRQTVTSNHSANPAAHFECIVTVGTGYLLNVPNEFYCQDEQAGISVITGDRPQIETGVRVAIVGGAFYAADDDEPQILASSVKTISRPGPPAAREVTLAEAVSGAYGGSLISAAGQVHVVAPPDPDREIFFLRDLDGNEMRAYLRNAPETSNALGLKPGDWVTVTGINLPREERRYQIRMRSAADVRKLPGSLVPWTKLLWAASAVLVIVGVLLRWAVSLRTKVRAQTREALRLRDRAEEASRLKSEFLANMSHEIRTPLHGVLGMQRLALDSASLSSEDRRHLEMAQESAQALLGLLNDILDFSKIEANKLELAAVAYDPRHLVESVCSLFVPVAEQKGLRLDWEAGESVPAWVSGDDVRVRQVLMNLVSNAVKFSSHGGVRVDLGGGKPGEIVFSVADTGPGVPADARERIFEPFRQADGSTSRKHGGSGLGLAISTRLAAMMGGRLWLDTSTAAGSCFRFSVQAPKAEKPATEIAAPVRPSRPLSILVVEDNRVNQKLILKLLERAGHLTALANNGKEALELIESSHFDLALMDVQMPEMDGVETTFRIRHRENLAGAQRMPIIGLTAHAMKGDRERFLAAGMDDYLSKPVAVEDLYAALSRAVTAPVTE
jgi:signal transduction histidine kinase/CheY-like chemotaxis protein